MSARWAQPADGPEIYLAAPTDQPPAATVVVGMELFGVTAWVRGICHRLAAAGFAAAAPDFFGRVRPRAELGYHDRGREEGFHLLGSLTPEQVAADTANALTLGTGLGAGPGRGFAGFSLGGHLALLAGTLLPLDVITACYPGWAIDGGIALADPEPPLSPAGAAALASHGTTVLGLVGEQDHVVPPEQWERIGRRLTTAGVRHELVSYPDTPHGFLCEDRPATYRPHAADDAWSRILKALEPLRP